jgi:hypothetical protein
VFRASDNLFRLFSHLDVHDVGFAPSLMNDADPSVVSPVWHALMDGGFDQDGDLLSWLIDS